MAKMAIDYKVGDKVRVTHEGTVTRVDGTALRLNDANDGRESVFEFDEGDSMEVEVLERKGPKPGTVATSRGGVYVQLADGSVRATYFEKGDEGITQILVGPVTTWGDVIHEPSA